MPPLYSAREANWGQAVGRVKTVRGNLAAAERDLDDALAALGRDGLERAQLGRQLDDVLRETQAMRAEMTTVFAALDRIHLHPSLGNLPNLAERSAFLSAKNRVEVIAGLVQAVRSRV